MNFALPVLTLTPSHTPYIPEDPHIVAAKLSAQEGVTLRVILPKENEVFVDLDALWAEEAEAALLEYQRRFDLLRLYCPEAEEIARRHSRHGVGYHVIVRVPFVLTPAQRVALQASLGSDFKRELIASVGLLKHVAWPVSVFYEIDAPCPDAEVAGVEDEVLPF